MLEKTAVDIRELSELFLNTVEVGIRKFSVKKHYTPYNIFMVESGKKFDFTGNFLH